MSNFADEGLQQHRLRWEEFWYHSEPVTLVDSQNEVPVYIDPTLYRRTGRRYPPLEPRAGVRTYDL